MKRTLLTVLFLAIVFGAAFFIINQVLKSNHHWAKAQEALEPNESTLVATPPEPEVTAKVIESLAPVETALAATNGPIVFENLHLTPSISRK
jgi:hypothetical protein